MRTKDNNHEINHSNSSNILKKPAYALKKLVEYSTPGIFGQFIGQTVMEGLTALGADATLDPKTKQIVNFGLLAGGAVIMAAPDVYKACINYTNNNRQKTTYDVELGNIKVLEEEFSPRITNEMLEHQTKETVRKKKSNVNEIPAHNTLNTKTLKENQSSEVINKTSNAEGGSQSRQCDLAI